MNIYKYIMYGYWWCDDMIDVEDRCYEYEDYGKDMVEQLDDMADLIDIELKEYFLTHEKK